MTPDSISDDEVILRHIPGGPSWQAPPDGRISSINFRLRRGESGISVSRASLMTPAEMMTRLGDLAKGSKIATVTAAEIRDMGLEIVAAPIPEDPGHAEIRPAAESLKHKEMLRQLARAFRYIEA